METTVSRTERRLGFSHRMGNQQSPETARESSNSGVNSRLYRIKNLFVIQLEELSGIGTKDKHQTVFFLTGCNPWVFPGWERSRMGALGLAPCWIQQDNPVKTRDCQVQFSSS